MAELDTSSGGGKKGGKVRSKKANTKVDLTAMVDLAFLLITFFMLTTSLSKPQAMDVAKPDKDEDNPENRLELKASMTMTILLGKNDKVAWYMGEMGASAPTIETINQVGKSIAENKKKVDAANAGNPKANFVVLVKPTKGANYQNFVDIMDELEIRKVKVRQIDDDNIMDPEIDAMKQQGIL
jgi:biopolymer transport protein ExbD